MVLNLNGTMPWSDRSRVYFIFIHLKGMEMSLVFLLLFFFLCSMLCHIIPHIAPLSFLHGLKERI